ncbi:hypothetical protein DV103_08695, partial [Bifidobacterium animalis subsp. lactis]|uniref:hypothetical protein n=1 Tax=Bifidobacterium animalis TaxID=28025 RepID=UPI0021D10B4C
MTLGDTIRRAIAWADAPPATLDEAQAAAQERQRQLERGAAIDARMASRQAQADAEAAAFAERRAATVRTLADQAEVGRTLRSAYAGALQAWRTATEQRSALASELAALAAQLPTDDKAILAQVRRANTIRVELPTLDGRIVEL